MTSSVILAYAIALAPRSRPFTRKKEKQARRSWRGTTAPPSLIFPARRTVYVYLHKMASRRNF